MIFSGQKDGFSRGVTLVLEGFGGGSSVVTVGLKCYILYGVAPANDECNVGMAKIGMIQVLVMNI